MGADTAQLTLTLPSGATGRGSKQSRAQASGLFSHVPAWPPPRRCCLFWEAFLDCCQPHPALCSHSPKDRAHAGSAFPELLLASGLPGQPGLSPVSLPEEGSQGSPGLVGKCLGQCWRGRQLCLKSAEARGVLTCRDPDNSHPSPVTRGHLGAEVLKWSALESASQFKIPNPEQFGQSWLQSHLEEGPGFKLGAPGPWGLPTPHQALWVHRDSGSTWVGGREDR